MCPGTILPVCGRKPDVFLFSDSLIQTDLKALDNILRRADRNEKSLKAGKGPDAMLRVKSRNPQKRKSFGKFSGNILPETCILWNRAVQIPGDYLIRKAAAAQVFPVLWEQREFLQECKVNTVAILYGSFLLLFNGIRSRRRYLSPIQRSGQRRVSFAV